MLPGTATIFGLDSYYADLAHLPFSERIKFNFDHPAALEDAMLSEHLLALSRGQAIQRPIYDFSTHTRVAGRFDEIRPGDFLIVEGLFTFYWHEVRAIFDFKVFIGARDPVCLERRKVRDIRERGRTADFVLSQYQATVRPGNENFVTPTRRFADLVVSGEQPIEESARQIQQLIDRQLSRR